ERKNSRSVYRRVPPTSRPISTTITARNGTSSPVRARRGRRVAAPGPPRPPWGGVSHPPRHTDTKAPRGAPPPHRPPPCPPHRPLGLRGRMIAPPLAPYTGTWAPGGAATRSPSDHYSHQIAPRSDGPPLAIRRSRYDHAAFGPSQPETTRP